MEKKTNQTRLTSAVIKSKGGNPQRQAIYEWAYWGDDWGDVLRQLKEKALDENWAFAHSKDGRLPILDNYIRYTFFQVQKEEKISYTNDGNWAIFNTGLVNKRYLPIYALLEKNKKQAKQKWAFNCFMAEGEKASKNNRISVVSFPNIPKHATFYENLSDLLYRVSDTGNELFPNYEHIISDNVDRLPIALLQEIFPTEIEEREVRDNFESRAEYDTYLTEYNNNLRRIVSKEKNARKLQERFKSSIDTARKRIMWNYKTAIPIYYPKNGKISFLLPLCLVDEDKVDLALVVSKGDGGYLAETIYKLEWAYKCARLICRPDSDWLSPNTIIDNDEND